MRKLYEIKKDIEDLLNAVTDPDTGEVVDPDALDSLLLERDQKIENVALYAKDVNAEWVAVTHEIMILQQRADRLKNTEDGLKQYLARELNGEKFKTSKCDIGFRKSESADVDDDFIEWASDIENCALHFLRKRETVSADKEKIKKFLKEGGKLEHCKLVTKYNISIK